MIVMKLSHIDKILEDIYQIIIGIAALVGIIFLLPYLEISIYGVFFGAMILGIIGIPALLVYEWIKKRARSP
jgi:hypothetical protein